MIKKWLDDMSLLQAISYISRVLGIPPGRITKSHCALKHIFIMTSFEMAAKETVGEFKLCIVLLIFHRISQFLFLFYGLEVMNFKYAKQINKKSLEMCLKTIRYTFFSRFSNELSN